jgi:hypothetical protein
VLLTKTVRLIIYCLFNIAGCGKISFTTLICEK